MDVVVERFDIILVRIANVVDKLIEFQGMTPPGKKEPTPEMASIIAFIKRKRSEENPRGLSVMALPVNYSLALQSSLQKEPAKKQLCLVVSPDELNRQLYSVIVAPMTTQSKPYPTRVPCHYEDKDGYILLDQIRAVHKRYLGEKVGHASEDEARQVLAVLGEMFAE